MRSLLACAALCGSLVASAEPAKVISSSSSRERPKYCVGWAALGALVGSYGLTFATAGGQRLAGVSSTDGRSDLRDNLVLLSAFGAGLAAGPVLTCGLFSDEPHLVPAASLVLPGFYFGFLSGMGAGAALLGTSEGGMQLAVLAGAAGGVLGASLGGVIVIARDGGFSVTPIVTGRGGGVGLSGRF